MSSKYTRVKQALGIVMALSGLAGMFFGILIGYTIMIGAVDEAKESAKITAEELDTYKFVVADNMANYNDNLQMCKDEINELSAKLYEATNNIGDVSLGYQLTEEEFDLLCRCIQAEAGPKNFESQRMILHVIMNRVVSEDFPNSVEDVIMEHNDKGLYQFSVVENGMIETEATEEVKLNVMKELLFNEVYVPKNILYFHATDIDYRVARDVWKRVEGTTFAY